MAGQVAPHEPVVTQPGHHTTVVVQAAGVMGGRPLRDWSTGLCGCFEDIPSCLLVTFCQNFYACYLTNKAGEGWCLPCLLPGWLLPLRSHIRGKHSIQGTITNDCCIVGCCYPCAMCQLYRELDNIEKGKAAY